MSARQRPSRPASASHAAPWPSDDMLARMGLRRCPAHGCTTWIDPVNLPGAGGHCLAHRREHRQTRRKAAQ